MQVKETADLTRRFQTLLMRHAELCADETGQLKKVVENLLPAFLGERKKWAESQRASPDEFNLFEVLNVAGNEVCHSTLLAWLLDHRIEKGTHAQGNLGFRLFLEEFATELRRKKDGDVSRYAGLDYWVDCEVSGNESRVDIEIASQNEFLIHIENKIHAGEGPDQTNREWRDLQARRKQFGVPEDRCHAVFLSLDGTAAENQHFRAIRWGRIARVLERFADLAEPPEVRLFARHYSKAIRNLSAMERDEKEADDGDV